MSHPPPPSPPPPPPPARLLLETRTVIFYLLLYYTVDCPLQRIDSTDLFSFMLLFSLLYQCASSFLLVRFYNWSALRPPTPPPPPLPQTGSAGATGLGASTVKKGSSLGVSCYRFVLILGTRFRVFILFLVPFGFLISLLDSAAPVQSCHPIPPPTHPPPPPPRQVFNVRITVLLC